MSPSNGIWLCQNCAKLVDNDSERYGVDVLRRWKIETERDALDGLKGSEGDRKLVDRVAPELTVSYSRVRIENKRHDYRFHVSIENSTIERIREIFVEVEFPQIFVENPESVPGYVDQRSSDEMAFFRVTVADDVPLFPGDTISVFELDYFVDDQLFWKHDKTFFLPIVVRATADGASATEERIIKDFQCF